MSDPNRAVIEALTAAYNAELETVMNYIANSVNLDGVRAKHIKNALEGDIQEEIGHAQMLAKRIKTIGGFVPGSQALSWTQTSLQPPADTTDIVSVIKGVIEAEEGAIEGYRPRHRGRAGGQRPPHRGPRHHAHGRRAGAPARVRRVPARVRAGPRLSEPVRTGRRRSGADPCASSSRPTPSRAR